MEGTDNNKCLPDLWMSQVDPQYSGNLGNSSLREAMSSPTHLDLSRKQPALYNDYDLSNVHYKQSTQMVSAQVMQQYAPPSTRSAWEFAGENFSSQSLPQSVANTTPRYSQSVHDFTLQQNVSQPLDRRFASNNVSQSHRSYAPENLSQPPLGNFMTQNTQPIREQTSHIAQQNARTDRSVWSHLYSLDPSIASYSMTGQTAQNTNFNQDKPYSYSLPRSEGTSTSAIDRSSINTSSVHAEKHPLILGKVTSAEQIPSSYINQGSLPAENIPISSLGPTMYSDVLGNTNVTKQSSSVSYEDEIGGYSPVSPPTHETPSPFPAQSNDRNADLSLKADSFTMSSSLSDFSSSNTNKTLPVNKFMHSDSSMLQISHDVPLDMSKGWSSQNTDHTAGTPITCSSAIQLSQPVTQNDFSFGISNQHSDMPNKHFAADHQVRAPGAKVMAPQNLPRLISGNQVSFNKLNEASSVSQVAPDNLAVSLSMDQFSTNKPTDSMSVNQLTANIENKGSDISPSVNQFAISNESPASHSTTNSNIHIINQLSTNKSSDSFATKRLTSSKSTDIPFTNQFSAIECSETNSANQANFSQKIAPKKSNFYGRDASYFSVPEIPSQMDDARNTNVTISEDISSNQVKIDPVLSQADSNAGSIQTFDSYEIKEAIPGDSLLPAGIESNSTSFADSFIDATTAPSPENDDRSFDDRTEDLSRNEKDDNAKNVNLIEEKINDTSCALDQKDDTVGVKAETGDVPEIGPEIHFNVPNTVSNMRGGKAPRGRKRRGGATQRRQPKKASKKTLDINFANIEADIVPNAADTGTKDDNDGNMNTETAPSQFNHPAPKPRSRRGRKRVLSADMNNPDSDGSTTRRSSSRRSKDNAMRLIELQAESIYGHVAKPVVEEPIRQQPSKPRRKAAKAAVKSTTFSDRDDEDLVEGKDISSDETSDGKDADYAVDDEDVEAMEKDELLDVTKDQKKPTVEKKGGGLKISIKLGVDASAEIVSGLEKSPPRKKKRVIKKKPASQKFKSKAIIQDDDLDDDDNGSLSVDTKIESEEKRIESENSKNESGSSELKDATKEDEREVKNEIEEKGDIVDKHNSLMDKYFSSATQARPVHKMSVKKDPQSKRHDTSKSKLTKVVKSSIPKTNVGPPPHSSNDGNKPVAETNSTTDTGVPKFVCGYCPNRYHNKQELLSHMEGHMAEMEDKPEKSSGGESTGKFSKELKKPGISSLSKKSESGKGALSKVGKKSEVSEVLKYNCGECGKSFSSKPNLLDHVRTHAAEKPFECNLCHKFFKERDQLSVHRKVHVQEGLLRCQFCQKGFVNNADLTAHMESHPKRTKSAQLHSKHPVSDPVKKVINIDSDPTKKNSNPVFDSSKKISKTQQISRDKEVVLPKPKSFASALEPSAVKDNPTLLLRRNDVSTSSSKDETHKTTKPIKPAANLSKTSKDDSVKKSSSKAQDVKKDSKESVGVKREPKETKIVDQRPKTSNEISVPSGINKEEKGNAETGECTCQECPECVTRFLNSFE